MSVESAVGEVLGAVGALVVGAKVRAATSVRTSATFCTFALCRTGVRSGGACCLCVFDVVESVSVCMCPASSDSDRRVRASVRACKTYSHARFCGVVPLTLGLSVLCFCVLVLALPAGLLRLL